MNESRPIPQGDCTAPHCDCEPGWCLQRTPATFTRTVPTHTGFDPEMGFMLDGANEGELAAYDFACAGMISALKKILDYEDDGEGVSNEPWESMRRRIIALRDSQRPRPINGIPATDFHDEGAIARCSYCGRYSLDPKTLSEEDRDQPVCECGEKHGWSGSFKKPGPDAKWSGRAPSGVAAPAPGHLWHDYGQENGRNRSWCSRCKLVVWTGEEPDSPCVSMPIAGVNAPDGAQQ